MKLEFAHFGDCLIVQSDSDLLEHRLIIDLVEFYFLGKGNNDSACTAGGDSLTFIVIVRIIHIFHNPSPLWRFRYSTTKNLIFLNCFKKIILLFDYKITFL